MPNIPSSEILNDEAKPSVTAIQMEIELLSGLIYDGDATALVYKLFKDSKDMKGLLEYLTGEVYKKNVCVPNTAESDNEVCDGRPSFEKWITQCEQL